jgi:hypothetical protein
LIEYIKHGFLNNNIKIALKIFELLKNRKLIKIHQFLLIFKILYENIKNIKNGKFLIKVFTEKIKEFIG